MDMDREMKHMQNEMAKAFQSKPIRRAGATFLVVWGLSILLSLSLTAGLIYVVIHFIAKWW